MSRSLSKKIELDIELVKIKLHSVLHNCNFSSAEANSLIQNVLSAEMAQKHSHGLARVLWIIENLNNGKRQFLKRGRITIIEKGSSLAVNGQGRIGCLVMDQSLDRALDLLKAKGNPIVCGITNLGPYSGCISHFALKAMNQGAGFLSFVDSPGGVIPYGCDQELWGTNPVTLGLPDPYHPILIDLSFAEKNWGDFYLNKLLNNNNKSQDFRSRPINGYKGSALIFLVKILAGVLTRTAEFKVHQRTSGIFFLLFSPSLFTHSSNLSQSLATTFSQLKEISQGEARLPGQKTLSNFYRSQKKKKVNVYDKIWKKILELEKLYA